MPRLFGPAWILPFQRSPFFSYQQKVLAPSAIYLHLKSTAHKHASVREYDCRQVYLTWRDTYSCDHDRFSVPFFTGIAPALQCIGATLAQFSSGPSFLGERNSCEIPSGIANCSPRTLFPDFNLGCFVPVTARPSPFGSLVSVALASPSPLFFPQCQDRLRRKAYFPHSAGSVSQGRKDGRVHARLCLLSFRSFAFCSFHLSTSLFRQSRNGEGENNVRYSNKPASLVRHRSVVGHTPSGGRRRTMQL